MEQQTPVSGGIGILHRVKDGRHHYEVDAVFNENTGFFMRQGDQLLMINDLDMQDLTPREFADLLSSGNPMLRIHHAGMDHPEKAPEKTGDFWSVFKEDTVLTFSMDMAVEPLLQGEDDGCDQDELEDGLLVELLGTCVEKVLGRGTDTRDEDYVLIPEAARVEAVEPYDFKKDREEKDKAIKHQVTQTFLSHKATMANLQNTKANITIYYYESIVSTETEGVPVALNFTGTKKFLQCSRTGDGVDLSVVDCKKDLQFIHKSDTEMAFVFFMKAGGSGEHTFESANCEGVFVKATSTTKVDAAEKTEPMDSLYFLIKGC